MSSVHKGCLQRLLGKFLCIHTLVSQVMCVSRWTPTIKMHAHPSLGLTGALGQECWPRCGSYPALKSILAMQTELRASPNALQRHRRAVFNRGGATLEMIEVSFKQIESLQGWNKYTIRRRDGEIRTTADRMTLPVIQKDSIPISILYQYLGKIFSTFLFPPSKEYPHWVDGCLNKALRTLF